MTFEQFIKQEIGYECKTTFWMDFSIADRFGIAAVKDTFKRAFKEWRTNVVYLTELVLVLNHKIWQHHGINGTMSKVYYDIWNDTNTWALDNLKGDDMDYYWRTLD